MNLIGKRILILGGNGYLGNYLAARLVQQQATVLALSRLANHNAGQDQNMNTQKIRPYNGSKEIYLNQNPSKIPSTAQML